MLERLGSGPRFQLLANVDPGRQVMALVVGYLTSMEETWIEFPASCIGLPPS